MPDLAEAAAYQGGDHVFRQVVHFEGDAERRFRALADKILNGEIEVYPALNFRASYFHRFTDRIVFQMTSGGPLIEWFDANFRVGTLIFVRHPIPNAFSIMERGWRPEYNDFLKHRWFVETQLEGAQVDFARRILAGRSLIAEHVLDWTLKMLVPLRAHASGRNPDWTLLTYEQLVLEPERMIDLVGRRHDLPEIQPMLAQVRRPSRTVSPNTKAKVSDPDFLLGRWRKRLASAEDEQELLRIPAAFGIEVYEPDRLTPREPYLWFGSS